MAQTMSYHSHELEQPVSPMQAQFSSGAGGQADRNDGEYRDMSPVSPIMSRRTSHESDRHSTASGLTRHFPSNPTNVNPAPAYVASFGASQVVSEHQALQNPPLSDTEGEDNDDGRNKEDTQFSEPALALVNAFLDQLLYSFLSTSRSTSLRALRPAVTDVLKHRLAREAISSADAELAELLAGMDEEEEIDTKHRSQEEGRKWDLELVWKRTRLRVMVYMRLGEMEDDDEQHYVQQEELFYGSERRFTSSTGLVSWSAAIFLTSVLEYVAEQTLQIAGQAAYTRHRRQGRNHRRSMSSDVVGRAEFLVEEYDVEKLALNSTLGRLWRTWRKALRNNGASNTLTQSSSSGLSRTSRENTASAMDQRRSMSTPREGSVANDSRPMSRAHQDDIPEVEYAEHILAANIPLPLADHTRDVDEIVVPGLARDPDDENDDEDLSDGPYPEYMLAVLVGLPLVDEKRDVDEIEVPGLAMDPDAESKAEEAPSKQLMRRKSFSGCLPRSMTGDIANAEESTPISRSLTDMPNTVRQRSASLPAPVSTPIVAEEPIEEMPLSGKEVTEHGHTENLASEHASRDVRATSGESNVVKGSETETTAQTSETKIPGKAAGVAVGVSAAAVTVTALASESVNGVSMPGKKSPDSTITQAKDATDVPEIHGSGVEEEQYATTQAQSNRDIEELDRRKSRLDIKQMVGVNGASRETSGQRSAEMVGLKTPSIKHAPSNESFSLGETEKQEQPLWTDDANEKPDVVSGSVVVDRAKSSVLNVDTQQVKEKSKRPTALVVNNSKAASSESSTKQTSTPRTPRQFLDLTDETESSTDGSPPAAVPASQYRDLVNGAAREPSATDLPTKNESPSRNSRPSIHNKQSSESGAVQEHPIVQRIASSKRSEPGSSSGSDKAVPLTSASIKGPQDFDLFVQGGETLKYTLTPEHVRDDRVDNQMRYAVSRNSPVEMDTTTASRQVPPSDSRTGRSMIVDSQTTNIEKRRSLSRPSLRNTSAHGKSGLMAREPRVMTDSTRDFADFIRSTGPDKDTAVTPIRTSASSISLHSLRSTAHAQSAPGSRSSSPGANKSRTVKDDGDVPPVPPIPRRGKPGMEARGAKITDDGSGDLIDFIRSGPKQDGERRISRSIAPFRTTMDSERFNEGDTGRSIETQAPADPSVRTTPSLNSSSQRTSANSRSALLNGSQPVSSAVRPVQQVQSRALPDNVVAGSRKVAPQAEEPSKRRYRNKDPYAIDFEDEEDDFMVSTPKASRKDESLLEFLRNHEPISNDPPRPLIDPNSAQAQRIIANARAGNHAADGRARTAPNNPGPRIGSQPSTQFAPANRQAQINSSVASSKPKLEARSSGSKGRSGTSVLNTNELADFFRNSGPAEDPNSAPAPSLGRSLKSTTNVENETKKAEKKRGSLFSRSKNQRYLDMP